MNENATDPREINCVQTVDWTSLPSEVWQSINSAIVAKKPHVRDYRPYDAFWQLSFLRCASKFFKPLCDDFTRRFQINIVRMKKEWPLTYSFAFHGQLDLLKDAVANGWELKNPDVVAAAAEGCSVPCLRYVHEMVGRWPWDVARTIIGQGNLECLQYVLSEPDVSWDPSSCVQAAAAAGYLHVLQYLVLEEKCPLTSDLCETAAAYNQLDVLRWARALNCPWDSNTVLRAISDDSVALLAYAIEHGCPYSADILTVAARSSSACVRYLHERGIPWCGAGSECAAAAGAGHLACLRYCHEHGASWTSEAALQAALGGHVQCLRYALEHGCTLPRDSLRSIAVQGHYETFVLAHQSGCPFPDYNFDYTNDVHLINGAEHYPLCTLVADNLPLLQYVHENGAQWDESVCEQAARTGSLACLQYAHEHGCPWGPETGYIAASRGHLALVQYYHENGGQWLASMCATAANNGHVALLKYAHEHGCPWDSFVCKLASAKSIGASPDHTHSARAACLEYAHSQGCPCAHTGVKEVPECPA